MEIKKIAVGFEKMTTKRVMGRSGFVPLLKALVGDIF